MAQFNTTVLFKERQDHDRLKIAAVVNGVTIGELLDQMVERELSQFTKQEVKKLLPKNTKREHLLAAW